MNIQAISQNFNNYKNTRYQTNSITYNTDKSMSVNDLNNLPNYSYQINFQGQDAKIIAEMRSLMKVKGYEFENLKQMFDKLSESNKGRINDFVSAFSKEGLTLENFLPCAVKANLFNIESDITEKNIRELVQNFEKDGLSTEKYLKTCIKQPFLFGKSAEAVTERIKAYMYVDRMNNKSEYYDVMDKIMKKNLCDSTSLIYLKGIVLPQLKQQAPEFSTWTNYELKPKLQEYFKNNPERKFIIMLPEDEMTSHFISVISEYCHKDFGRDNMFIMAVMK